MNPKKFLVDGLSVFVVTMIVSVIVTLLWNYFAHGTTTVDWATSVRFAIMLAVILPVIECRRSGAADKK